MTVEEALILALNTMKAQNDHLILTNATLVEQNQALVAQNEEFKKYMKSLSDIADNQIKMQHNFEHNKMSIKDIGDSLVMLWGQLTATGVVDEKRQQVPRSPPAPVAGVAATEYGITDLYCEELLEVQCMYCEKIFKTNYRELSCVECRNETK